MDQIIPIIVSSLAFIVSVLTFVFHLKTYKNSVSIARQTLQRDAIKEAVKIAELFANELVDDISFIIAVYELCGYYDIVKTKIDISRIKHFDNAEIEKLFSTKELSELKNKDNRINNEHVFAAIIMHPSYKSHISEAFTKDCTESVVRGISDKMYFLNTRVKIMNKLEQMSILINSGVADGDVIYQSLHFLFFKFMRCEYISISERNTSEKDKFYIHCIKLFQIWSTKYIEAENKEYEINRDLSPKIKMITKDKNATI